jgi:hypothetical protein
MKHRYLDMTTICRTVDNGDEEWDEADENVDLLLRCVEVTGHPCPNQQAAAAAAIVARAEERIALPQHGAELLQRPPGSLPPHQLPELYLTEHAADEWRSQRRRTGG